MKNLIILGVMVLMVTSIKTPSKNQISNIIKERIPASINPNIIKVNKKSIESNYRLLRYIKVYALDKETTTLSIPERNSLSKKLETGEFSIQFDTKMVINNIIPSFCVSENIKTNRFNNKIHKRILINKTHWYNISSSDRKELIMKEVNECYL